MHFLILFFSCWQNDTVPDTETSHIHDDEPLASYAGPRSVFTCVSRRFTPIDERRRLCTGVQARAALKGAAKEKSGALAAAMEARDAARAGLAVAEGAAEAARAEAAREASAARRRADEVADDLQAAQVRFLSRPQSPGSPLNGLRDCTSRVQLRSRQEPMLF